VAEFVLYIFARILHQVFWTEIVSEFVN